MNESKAPQSKRTLSGLIFLSRWLQAPLYFGLIVAQGVYVYHFFIELAHLVQQTTTIKESEIMLMVLGLIDVVMIANLLIINSNESKHQWYFLLPTRESRGAG